MSYTLEDNSYLNNCSNIYLVGALSDSFMPNSYECTIMKSKNESLFIKPKIN